MTNSTATAQPERTETYTHRELDELGGALLYVGGLSHTFSHLLDVTADLSDLSLIELVNHAPDGLASEVLAGLVPVIEEVKARLSRVSTAFDSALDSLAERVQRKWLDSEFGQIMQAEYGDQAGRDGL